MPHTTLVRLQPYLLGAMLNLGHSRKSLVHAHTAYVSK